VLLITFIFTAKAQRSQREDKKIGFFLRVLCAFAV